jgi:hypothetical protein
MNWNFPGSARYGGLSSLADVEGYGEGPSAPVNAPSRSAWSRGKDFLKKHSDWGNDPIMNEKIGSVAKGGLAALGGILDQGEADDAQQASYATGEDLLAREAYNARRKAAYQTGALSSLAGL